MPNMKAAESMSQMRHRTNCNARKNAENMEIVERHQAASHVRILRGVFALPAMTYIVAFCFELWSV
jgi:hypothetical protein